MNILFDLVATQPIHGAVYHGGGEYSKAVFKAAVEKGYKFDALYDGSKPLDEYIKNLCNEKEISLIDLVGRSFFEVYAGYDVFFTGLPYGRFDQAGECNTRLFFTIHGVRSLEMPTDRHEIPFYVGTKDPKRILKALFIRFFPDRYKRMAAAKVRKLLTLSGSQIITVSAHTKYSLLNFFPELKSDQLHVCYSPLFNPIDPDYVAMKSKELLESLGLTEGEFYLGLGSGRWLKNNLRLARAFDKLVSDGRLKGRKLVLTGGTNIVYRSLKNKEHFLFLDYVKTELLESLFKGARALLYPSLNEGFGYPPLQAMKYGTPVLASAFSAVTEVCGDAVLYANPYSEDEIASRILMLEDEDLHKELAIIGPQRYNLVSNKQKQMLQEMLELVFKES
ncbi:glycosyltransferase family 1 protein [Oceanispirochaeta crateris]|uniref:Glycosyltransferase family 1 protein n=1 Tax=Oceanispirochaeta crateris TaxID=2518645 RepID=A0A5C1QKF0_9SPIO|nr:glycosyltransferase [Oceanispirochaeta crateris]QEN06996.1 glycosyltransferase family 1 protein [Oceanispirochaeta crateris]